MVLSPISASEIYVSINNLKPKVSRDELEISMELIQEISSSNINLLICIFLINHLMMDYFKFILKI